ncbi:hypothetical protein DFH07DRAFT_825802 [Mycena maculata]|uniref:Uncharacterized protein n=1 Tax=Mycena maculata TaxID=230809 RepID=A0AAD7NAQ8_9AGAR|nr:hypothetical protein DFH07DRAFT_825802 [Mycena maculata]
MPVMSESLPSPGACHAFSIDHDTSTFDMEKYTEEWAPTGVRSCFKLTLQESGASAQRPTAVGTGVRSTALCGFGWRFSFRVDPQSAQTVVVDDAGKPIDSFQLQLFFDPYLIKSAAYGMLTLAVHVENLIHASKPPEPIQYTLPRTDTPTLGTYVYPGSAPTPTISITVTFPATLGLTLPHPLEPQMERALEETLTGTELVDAKFYAFSRRGSESVTHPLPLFAKSDLLRGFSDDLDALLTGHGFSESAIVDLDLHRPEQLRFGDYGYESDSDLDSEEEEDSVEGSSSSDKFDTKVKSHQYARTGRVVVLKDTAFKTWKALLYYLYTRRINFRPLKSEGLLLWTPYLATPPSWPFGG